MAQEIPGGSTTSTYNITSPDDYTLSEGTTRTQTANSGIQATVTTGTTNIIVNGTLNATGFTTATSGGVTTQTGARAIRAGLVSGTISVGANGIVQAKDTDAIQAQASGGTTSVLSLNNLGQILSTSSNTSIAMSGTVGAAGYALNLANAVGTTGTSAADYLSGGQIKNGSTSNTTALIRSDGGDAIRLGSHQTLVNYGTINGNGLVNDAATNNIYSNTSTNQRYDNSRGVRIAGSSTNDRVDNYGTITGAQHGFDVGNTAASNIIVNNYAGGQIVGRNGSGVGSDTTAVAAGTVVVTNFGTIRGAYAPKYDRAGLTTIDGDGDGVDIDGGATITNELNATIEGTGAGGYDSNGRLNNSEGVSIGGGSIINSGLIRGSAFAIVVNNDSNTNRSRSGVTATQITNNSSGSIVGLGGYAIRLENKIGTPSGDNDTILNYGSISGNGNVPDTGQVIRRQDGSADDGTVGVLDGVTYTTADAGSVRFIRGDGSAIQMGEGNDFLANYGSITGNSGRALNLEGGDDTLNLYTGAAISGRIDGGAGNDTLNLRRDDRASTNVGGVGANSGFTSGTLSNVINFENLNVQGGSWTIASTQSAPTQTYATATNVASGAELYIDAGVSSTIVVVSGGSLGGAGTVTGNVIVDGTISGSAAGSGAISSVGALSTGALTFDATAILRQDVANATADLLRASGTIILNSGATLDVEAGGALSSAAGQSITLIDNISVSATTGRFTNLVLNGAASATIADDNTFQAYGRSYQINYGGTAQGSSVGNDIIITDVTPSYSITVAAGDGTSAAAASGAEGTPDVGSTSGSGTTFTYTAVRTGDTAAASTIGLSFTGSTAKAPGQAGADYSIASGTGTIGGTDNRTLTFQAGQSTATFTVTSTPDNAVEADETVVATLVDSPRGSTIGSAGTATATIANDDASYAIGVSPGTVTEGTATGSGATLTYTVTRQGDLSTAATVDIGFTGTATAPGQIGTADYSVAGTGTDAPADGAYSSTGTGNTGTLTFMTGQSTARFVVTTTPDAIYEGGANATPETVTATISNLSQGGPITAAAATGNIQDDDAAPILTINDVIVSEGDGTATFTVTRTGASQMASTVEYATADETAVSSSSGPGTPDYTGKTGTLTFDASTAVTATQTITIPITNDNVYETSEQFVVNLSNATNATITDSQGVGTITDNDADPIYSIAARTSNATEGSDLTFRVTRNSLSQGAQSVTLGFGGSGDTATAGTNATTGDYNGTAQVVTFAAGSTALFQDITVTTRSDGLYEGGATGTPESLTASLTTPTGGAALSTTNTTATATITDGDTAPTYSIAVDPTSVSEGGPGNALTYTVTRFGASAIDSTVAIALSGTATGSGSGTDYTVDGLTNGAVSFTGNATTASFTVTPVDDTVYDPNETVIATLSTRSDGGAITPNGQDSITGTIIDNEAAPTISIGSTTVVGYEENAGATNFTFTLTRDGLSQMDQTVAYAVTGGGRGLSPADGSDLVGGVLPSGIVTFGSGQTSQTINVPVSGDTSYEGNEAFTVTLGQTNFGNLGTASAVGIILNDDADPTPPGPTEGDDTINGTDTASMTRLAEGNDVYNGGNGAELVYGNQGNDSLSGGAGMDTLYGGQGDDVERGGADADLAYGNLGNDLIYGNQGTDTVYGGQGNDIAYGGMGDDRLYGNLGNDVLYGNMGADIVYGNQGADIVYGNQSNDMLYGGQGDDILYGGMGDDILVGGVGNNTLVGGVGADRYVFAANTGARDLVLGFNQSDGDRLVLGGQTYTTSTAQNGDALLTLSGGGTIDLAGIRADQVNTSFFTA